ncbi:TolC family protein [Dyadobacter subterraneus]|uniref:TolC family protein n=1 Tax=Dyadobacter subterraneus TaxID=2773304 RepID=A0ABR9W974_9BACT|nr:TolC family protein [Dyadobacter subterraneus]MBE9461987.1 TolC family protein [Dyadobacter subterraneus]
MKQSFYILVFAIFPLLSWAQQQLTLKQCIDYGLMHHRSVLVYKNDVDAATYKAKEALSAYLPAVNITSTIDDNIKVQQQVIPAGVFGPTDVKVAFTKRFSSNHFAQAEQTIFDKSLLTGLKANKISLKQAQLSGEQNQEILIYNISNAYYQILVYRQQLALLKANLESYKQQLAISKLQLEKGVAMEADVNKVQVNYNNIYSDVLAGESDLELAYNQLKNAMGYQLDDSVRIQDFDLDDPVVAQTQLSVGSFPSFSAANRIDFKLSEINIALLDIDQARIRATAVPKLSAYAKYGGIGFGDNLGESFSSISDYAALGIKLSIPVFDGFKRNAQYNQARIKQVNARENLKIDQQNFNLEYENARTKLIKATASLDNDKRNIALAESVFKSTDLQYQKGVTGLTDWLNSQYSLKEAQSNYLSSLYNYLIAKIDLEKANGTLTTFHHSL